MTANATRRPRDRSTRPAESFRRTVPMAGTGDGPRPDATTFAPTARAAGDRRDDRRTTDGRGTALNRTADDDSTQ
ncbi:hypothetical protein C463_11725 [Halorubrum californiense DSM 19288]|uniref:Uncharacterized protein n=1 Tax=Halorubrum californiense DSM 19288 TaxID=1227465 RepID=M0E4V2_9EURY|nr:MULTISPECIES: hypothetical protein [Halorubrum]ELZ41937.1 hypothetical protein C463_11725 [Halorubrum californiense DSM 19288]TKX65212.1 hypothetical protein EXE40_17105 [Halorubrum sp. GN11GM_10-3_MGM]